MTCNPHRGCGQKKKDAYYLEGPLPGDEGTIWAWNWALPGAQGRPTDRHIFVDNNQIPPRKTVLVNPAASFVELEIVPYNFVYEPGDEISAEQYIDMLGRTRQIGIGDHVGKKYYSAYSFAVETLEFGPSRRVSKEMAKVVAEAVQKEGPLPFLFVHDRIPVFSTESEVEQAIRIVDNCLPQEIDWQFLFPFASWMEASWGQYSREGQDSGWEHLLIPMLAVIGKIDDQWNAHKDIEDYRVARSFFERIRFMRQPFGMSWLTQVTYTLPDDDDGSAGEAVAAEIPGINILDLDAPHEDEEGV